jgi:hypothetical protein
MAICNCSLAGTKACDNCRNNSTDNNKLFSYKDFTYTDIEKGVDYVRYSTNTNKN